MTLHTHNRLILLGFLLGYFGVMGALAAFAFGTIGWIAIKFLFVPALVIGAAIIAAAKFTPVVEGH